MTISLMPHPASLLLEDKIQKPGKIIVSLEQDLIMDPIIHLVDRILALAIFLNII
jgi:hypothetical protein